ncbi:MAG: hypothetical protein QM635_12025, partial [Microbacteriaceae bacterium]
WAHVEAGRARLAAITVPAPGSRVVTVRGPGLSARIAWRGAAFRHALLWEELGATTAPPWDGAVHALGIEPTTTPHGAGTARPEGVLELRPGQGIVWSCRLRVAWHEPAAASTGGSPTGEVAA